MKFSLSLFLILLFCFVSFGQTFNKGDLVVPKFSKEATTFDKVKILGGPRTKSFVNITKSANSFLIGGKENWELLGFPIIKVFKIKDWDASKNKPTKIALRGEYEEIDINIPNDIDVQETLAVLLYKGSVEDFEKTDYFQNEKTKVLPIIFKDDLSVIPMEKQYLLLKSADYNSKAYSSSKFKDKIYLTSAYEDTLEYNTLQLNLSQRASRITDAVLKQSQNIFKQTGKITGIDGVKIVSDMKSRDFSDNYTKPTIEKFEMYVSFDLLQRFADAEITNQDVVDQSIILIDGSRVKVELANTK